MRKLWLCAFYALCAFVIVFCMLWMAAPPQPLPAPSAQAGAGSAASPPAVLAQALPGAAQPRYLLCDEGGLVAVYACGEGGGRGALLQLTDIYVNLLPEPDALRIKQGIRLEDESQLEALLEDLGH